MISRKEFFKKSAQGGLACCAAFAGLKSILNDKVSCQDFSKDLGKRMQDGAKGPDWYKFEKSQDWIKSILNHLDSHLDEKTKRKILNECGKTCFLESFGVADERKPTPEIVEKIFQSLEKSGFKVERGKEVTVIHYGWAGHQNPEGLSLKEGYCLCPIFQTDAASGVSPTYCNCSAGYVSELMERYTGRTVRKIEILETLLRGGKDCRFRIELSNS